MKCAKCGYKEKSNRKKQEVVLCTICTKFAPSKKEALEEYVSQKIDWKLLDTFRKTDLHEKLRSTMSSAAESGKLVSRPPRGYSLQNGVLTPNEDASKIHSLFKTFLNRKYSLNSLAKNFSLSTNGLKKVLSNRTYLGEIKFDGKLYKGQHEPIISQEIFYAVQRKLQGYLRSKKG